MFGLVELESRWGGQVTLIFLACLEVPQLTSNRIYSRISAGGDGGPRPVSATAQHPARPQSTAAEFFSAHMSTKSPANPQNSYGKFRNCRTTFENIPPLLHQKIA